MLTQDPDNKVPNDIFKMRIIYCILMYHTHLKINRYALNYS